MGARVDFDSYAREALRPLLRFAVVLTGDTELAQDIVQEALLRACARWDDISAVDNPHAYVRRIVVNESVSWQRKWGRVHAAPLELLDRAQSGAHAIDERDGLLRELDRLPVRQRAVLVLRYFEDMTDAEIADVLGCRPVTVRGYAHRALAALRIDSRTALEATR